MTLYALGMCGITAGFCRITISISYAEGIQFTVHPDDAKACRDDLSCEEWHLIINDGDNIIKL